MDHIIVRPPSNLGATQDVQYEDSDDRRDISNARGDHQNIGVVDQTTPQSATDDPKTDDDNAKKTSVRERRICQNKSKLIDDKAIVEEYEYQMHEKYNVGADDVQYDYDDDMTHKIMSQIDERLIYINDIIEQTVTFMTIFGVTTLVVVALLSGMVIFAW